MTQTDTVSGSLNILKQAILLEKRGFAFYQKVAEQAQESAVKSFFESMAQEEIEHIKVLSKQYKAFKDDGKFLPGTFDRDNGSTFVESVLNPSVREKISAAGFEAAAISAAIAMEQRAVDLYSEQAKNATDPEEKKLYDWLSAWEREHLNALLEIDRALLDQIWEDNQFWPF